MYKDFDQEEKHILNHDAYIWENFLPNKPGRNVLPKSKASFITVIIFTSTFFYFLFIVPYHHRNHLREIDFESFVTGTVYEGFSDRKLYTVTGDENGRTADLESYGRNFNVLDLQPNDLLINSGIERLQGKPFNLAILKLPLQSNWEYLGVARGPLNVLSSGHVPGTRKDVVEHSLIGFGLNLTEEGKFHIISKASFLSIPTRPLYGCKNRAFFRGPEDPRVYWSDYDTPMLTFTMHASDQGLCRGIWLVQDLREIWPELAVILASVPKARPYQAGHFGDVMKEVRKIQAAPTEKNWLAFFPGPKKEKTMSLPNMHYKLSPDTVLTNTGGASRNATPNQSTIVEYAVLRNEEQTNCLQYLHPDAHKNFHQATPLARLTLCPRGHCKPNTSNTIFVSLGHYLMRKDGISPRAYGRFFLFYNTTSPFNLLASGPLFHFNGVRDTQMIFALSTVFVEQKGSKQQESPQITDTTSEFGPSHGFLDDKFFISLGIDDERMATIELSILGEMMNFLKPCLRDNKGA